MSRTKNSRYVSSSDNDGHDFEVKQVVTEPSGHTSGTDDYERGVVKSPQQETPENGTLTTSCPKAFYVMIALAVLASAGYGGYFFLNQKGIVLKPVDASQNPNYMAGGVSMAELALHDTPEDCWLELHGNVYDLTNYANSHPGGASIITDWAGSQATDMYDVYHGAKLLDSIPHTLIGRFLVDSSSTTSSTSGKGSGSSSSATNGSGSTSSTGGSGSTSTTTSTTDNNCYVQQYTLQDLQSNNLWLSFYGQVYNLDSYRHPGGSSYIKQGAGTDATQLFETKHSQSLLSDSRKGIQSYWIGELADVSGKRQVQC